MESERKLPRSLLIAGAIAALLSALVTPVVSYLGWRSSEAVRERPAVETLGSFEFMIVSDSSGVEITRDLLAYRIGAVNAGDIDLTGCRLLMLFRDSLGDPVEPLGGLGLGEPFNLPVGGREDGLVGLEGDKPISVFDEILDQHGTLYVDSWVECTTRNVKSKHSIHVVNSEPAPASWVVATFDRCGPGRLVISELPPTLQEAKFVPQYRGACPIFWTDL